mmetsp:Transcript_13477/g.26487  ORF Transcript_13477/g.26487 Transcript_13477/m.26487 type:complete len:251 (+) Transcript_13477:1209-1961(+)
MDSASADSTRPCSVRLLFVSASHCCCSSSPERSARPARANASSRRPLNSTSRRWRSSEDVRCNSASAFVCSCRKSVISRWCFASKDRSRCCRSSATTCALAPSSSTCRRAWSKASSLAPKRSAKSDLSNRQMRSFPARCCLTASSVPRRSRRDKCVSSQNWLDSTILSTLSGPLLHSKQANILRAPTALPAMPLPSMFSPAVTPGTAPVHPASMHRRSNSASCNGKLWKSTSNLCSDFKAWKSPSPNIRL